MPMVRVSNGGSKSLHIDLLFPSYYGQIPHATFNNIGWKSATLKCTDTGGTFWRLALYGDNTLIATAYGTQPAVTVDVSSYSTLRVTIPEGGNTFTGWLELS